LSTTIGGALGTLIVTALLDSSWPVRIGLFAVVVVVGLAFILWRHRAEIAAGAQADGIPEGGAAAAGDTQTDSPTDSQTDAPTDAATQGEHP